MRKPLVSLIFFTFVFSVAYAGLIRGVTEKKCARTCKIKIVETIPCNVTFPGYTLPESTAHAWLDLINRAKTDINIAAYKMSLQGEHVLNGTEADRFAKEGDSVFNALLNKSKQVSVRLVDKEKTAQAPDHNKDGAVLNEMGAVSRRPLEISALLGSGINHIKLIVVDDAHFYIGSANFDWRSLNQKMELGIVVTDCPCLGKDVRSLFDSLWEAAGSPTVSPKMEWQGKASYNITNQFQMDSSDTNDTDIFVAGNPVKLLDKYRTPDITALVDTITGAEEELCIHVMDYFPMFLYGSGPAGYWPLIDAAIRNAILRGVRVRILGSPVHFEGVGMRFLRSLEDLDGMKDEKLGVYTDVKVKVFVVPLLPDVSSAVNENRRTHNKFIVTEGRAYVGTSNWAGDYFASTTGASIVITQNATETSVVHQLRSIFDRDFESEYAHTVEEYYTGCIEARTASFCQPQEGDSFTATGSASTTTFITCIFVLFLRTMF